MIDTRKEDKPEAKDGQRSASRLKRQTKLPHLNIHRPVKGAGDVLGNFPSCVLPQPLLRHRKPHKRPTGSLLDQVCYPFGGDHARHQPNVIAWGDRPRFANSASIGASTFS